MEVKLCIAKIEKNKDNEDKNKTSNNHKIKQFKSHYSCIKIGLANLFV